MSIDISALSLDELKQLAAEVALAFETAKANKEESITARKQEVQEAISVLENLLGEEGASPNLDNIRGVLGFTDEQMAENSGLALRLVFQGMEILTKATLNLAYVISK